MNVKLMAIIAVAALTAGGAGAYMLLSDDGGQGGVPEGQAYSGGPLMAWSYWLGDIDSAGVSDARTPISAGDMKELWKVSDPVSSSSTNWRVPGSAVCVGDLTYYFRGSDNTLNCVVTSTGAAVAWTDCPSGSVYNMAIAYGDGKIFVPTLSGSSTVMRAYDSVTLEQLFVSEPVGGGEVQGPITYYNGKVYFGTYGGDFACFDSKDTDPSKGDEIISPAWVISGSGWYNMTPAFFGDVCVIAEKGFDIGGAVVYSVDTGTGAIRDLIEYEYEYCVSGIAAYKGRAYIALNAVTDKNGVIDQNAKKTLRIDSFTVGSGGKFDISSKQAWTSAASDGGTQSTPVIWNDRLYIGGGGSTLGTNEPFNVIDIAADGAMSTAYVVNELKTKGTASITTAYSAGSNNYAVYIYLIEYGKVLQGEAFDSPIGTADIFVLKDAAGQTSPDIVLTVTPSQEQFAYQSFTISPDGYLLIRNDSTLFCYGPSLPNAYSYDDVTRTIARILSMADDGNVNAADIKRAEARYDSLSDADKAKVDNYGDLRAMYRTVTFVIDGTEIKEEYPLGSVVSVPHADIQAGRTVTGWTSGGKAWDIVSDVVKENVTITAVISDAAAVSFDPAGGSSVPMIYVQKGTEMGYVKDPVRSGYTFGGWFSGGASYEPQRSVVNDDITLTAKWLKDSSISFDPDGGSSAPPVHVTFSKEVGELPVTFRSGYTFEGWWHGGTLYTEGTVYGYENDIVLKAKWSENSDSEADNGKGITVSGPLPAGAGITVSRAFATGAPAVAIKAYAGIPSMDILLITVTGDGVDASQEFTVTLPVGTSFSGTDVDVYYYADGSVHSITVTVTAGVLSVTPQWTTTSGGIQTVIGIASGTEIGDHI